MTLGVGHADHYVISILRRGFSFSHDQAAVAGLHLDAMIFSHTQPNTKPKCFAKPVGCGTRIWIAQDWNYSARRYRAI